MKRPILAIMSLVLLTTAGWYAGRPTAPSAPVDRDGKSGYATSRERPAPGPGNAGTSETDVSSETDGSSPEGAGATPEVVTEIPTTIAELTAVVDAEVPLEQKVAILAAAVRGTDDSLAYEAARRLTHTVKHADFTRHWAPLLADISISRAALDALVLNLYDRPLDLSLPEFARIAENRSHPSALEARDTVRFHLREQGELTAPALREAVSEHLRVKWARRE